MFCLLAVSCVVLPDPGGNLPEGGNLPLPDGSGNDYAAFVVTSDFTLTGGFGVVGLDDRSTYFPDLVWAAGVVSPDPVAKAYGDYVFVLNRYTYDNISVLNRKMNLVKQYSVADSSCDPSNPHDLEFASDTRAFLTRYECKDLWVINPVTGQHLSSINLTAAGYGGSDHIPEMSGELLFGNTLFVAVQLMDRTTWKPEGPGKIVIIDATTETVLTATTLSGADPATDLIYSPGLDLILVATTGRYSVVGDGGIEAINPYTGALVGYIIDETTLGGNIGDFEIASATRGYVTISSPDFKSSLLAFNPSTGTRYPGSIYQASSGFTLWDIALNDRSELYVCDRTATSPGLAVFDTLLNDAVLPPLPINLGLPPFSIVFLR